MNERTLMATSMNNFKIQTFLIYSRLQTYKLSWWWIQEIHPLLTVSMNSSALNFPPLPITGLLEGLHKQNKHTCIIIYKHCKNVIFYIYFLNGLILFTIFTGLQAGMNTFSELLIATVTFNLKINRWLMKGVL